MPKRKSFKDLHFKTAEQIKLNTKKLKCKLCGKKVRGKSTLSRHISHAHSDIDPVKREKYVIDEYFGKAKVDDAIKKYKARIYNLSTIPIDISRYIRLAEIEPDDLQTVKKLKKEELPKHSNEKIKVPEDYSVVQLADYDAEEDAPMQFVEDIVLDLDNEILKLKSTQTLKDSLPFDLLKAFVRKLKLKDIPVFVVGKNKDLCKISSIESVTKDEVTDDRIQCVVTYSEKDESK